MNIRKNHQRQKYLNKNLSCNSLKVESLNKKNKLIQMELNLINFYFGI